MSSSGGYGISGHTNSYTTGVRVGNWVEDVFGNHLANHLEKPKLAGLSEAQEQFLHPASRSQQPENAMHAERPSMRGLEENLLLAHCEKGNAHNVPEPKDKYVTTHNTSFGPRKHTSPMHQLVRKRLVQAEIDRTESPYQTSYQAHSAAPYLPQAGARVGKPDGQRHASSRSFTQTFVQAQKFSFIRKGY